MLSMFAERRKKFLEAMGAGAVALLAGAVPQRRAHDTEFRFRQDSDFHYLTGFDHPNALAIFRSDGDPDFTLFCEPRDPEAETWNGYRPGVEGAVADYGAACAFPRAEFAKRLPALLAGAARVYFAPSSAPALAAEVFALFETQRMKARTAAPPPDALVDPRSILHEMRLRKTPAEVELLRRAASITREAHARAARNAHDGVMEYEIEALLDYTFRRRGGWGAAYGSIVAGGARATTLHYVANDKPLRDGELLLIDAGCEFAGYAADVTRTYPVGGRVFARSSARLYEVVLAAQHAAIALARPGATLPALHDAALRVLVAGLVDSEVAHGRGGRAHRKRGVPALLHARHFALDWARCSRRRRVPRGQQAARA